MAKKIKRYIDNLSYKKAYNIARCIWAILTILLMIFLGFLCFTKFLVLGFFIFIPGCFLISFGFWISLLVLFDLDEKEKNEKVENIMTNILQRFNDNNYLQIIPSDDEFPIEIIARYLSEKNTTFWLRKTDSEEPEFEIFIKDSDNPEKEYIFPEKLKNGGYLIDHFHFTEDN